MELLESVYKDCRIPIEFWEGLLGLMVIGASLLSLVGSVKTFLRYLSLLLFIGYAVLIFCCTVIFRMPYEFEVHLIPFWSYYSLFLGKWSYIHDILLNILVFTPFGLFLGGYLRNHQWLHCIIFAVLFSVCIENIQFVFQKGVAETDDVIHNTVGCILGLFILRTIKVVTLRYNRILIDFS